MNRKKIIIIISIVILFMALIIAAIFKVTSPTEDPKEAYLKSAIQTTIDRDTGEQITTDPNLSAQTEETRKVTVLGMETIVAAGALGEQVNYIKDVLNAFSTARLNNKYQTITIRPQDSATTDGVTITTIRLGQSDEILPVTITAKDTGETQVIIYDSANKYGGNYEGELTVFGAD